MNALENNYYMFEVEDDVRLERMSDLGYVFEVSED